MIEAGVDLGELARANGLSIPLALGIGAGLGFEYRRNAHQSPSRVFTGLDRDFPARLPVCARAYLNGEPRDIVLNALHQNALSFSLDSSPFIAIMGMEMLAEELPLWEELDDWQSCSISAHNTITTNDALYRRFYLRFLNEIVGFLPGVKWLIAELDEIASEWDSLAVTFKTISMNSVNHLFSAGSKMRRLASREEHFWGKLLEASEASMVPAQPR